MNICQIVYLCWMMLGVGIGIAEHGKPKTGRNNAWISIISAALQIALLAGAGFFE